MAKQNKPAIRFKEFTDAWEQRKAKELCNIGTGKSNTQDQVEDGIYPFYIRSDIPVKSNKYLYDCEAVITIGDGNIGRVFHYVNGKFDLHQRCYKMTDFQDIWGKYFYYFFSTRFYDRAMKMTAKATVDSVRLEMISEMDIWKPTAIDEQKKIAEFFANLDHLITLHQRKYDKLQVLKKAMLEKMFPKNGSSVPEIRFKGFTDAWEQRKLGKISEIKTGPFGSTLHADDYVSEGVPIITTEHFKTGSLPQSASGLPQVSEVDYKRLSAYTLNNGDIVFSRVGSVDINALVTPFQRNWLFSGRVLRVRPGIDVLPQFLHTRLETESIRNDICARAVGQTMPSINTEILKATQLVLPTSMAEQKQIGLYFAKLDHLITLHQRELEKLQNIKKSMLEKMFV